MENPENIFSSPNKLFRAKVTLTCYLLYPTFNFSFAQINHHYYDVLTPPYMVKFPMFPVFIEIFTETCHLFAGQFCILRIPFFDIIQCILHVFLTIQRWKQAISIPLSVSE